MTVTRAPVVNEITIENKAWLRWFTNASNTLGPPNRDAAAFTPVFTGLTEAGAVVKTGSFVRDGQVIFFDVLVESAAGTSASSLGTTNFLLPSLLIKLGGTKTNSQDIISAQGYGTVTGFNVETPADLGHGYIDINTLKVFTPAWTATGDKISLTGWVRIQGL